MHIQEIQLKPLTGIELSAEENTIIKSQSLIEKKA